MVTHDPADLAAVIACWTHRVCTLEQAVGMLHTPGLAAYCWQTVVLLEAR